jgi:hypothetical protein
MLSSNQAVGSLPQQRSDQQQNYNRDRQGDAARAALILLPLLDHAVRAHHHTPRPERHRALPIGVQPGECGEQIGRGSANLPRAFSAGSPLLPLLMLWGCIQCNSESGFRPRAGSLPVDTN